MKKLYPFLQMAICFYFLFPETAKSQCALLNATYTTYESRCAATGAIKVNVTGRSGYYNYKKNVPVKHNVT